MVKSCGASDEIDLTMDATVDHRAVLATIAVESTSKERDKTRKEATINKSALANEWARQAFQQEL